MDFWLGRWEVSFAGPDGAVISGTNTVSKHRGRIYELFVVPDEGGHYVGASVTRRDVGSGLWVQEYWDNQGYRAWYEGGWKDDGFILEITARGGHEAGAKRLVWRDVGADALRWDNEQSTDGGRTWTSTWSIEYRRAAVAPSAA
jgi:hypothetical protein